MYSIWFLKLKNVRSGPYGSDELRDLQKHSIFDGCHIHEYNSKYIWFFDCLNYEYNSISAAI